MTELDFNSSQHLTTSNHGKYRDYTPHLRPAGKVVTDSRDSMASCMKDDPTRPSTPTHLRPYRKSYQYDVGHAAQHYGTARDPQPPEIRFGMVNDKSEGAQSLIYLPQESAVAEKWRNVRESTYHRERQEPLGRRPYYPGLVLPAITNTPEFKFGCKTDSSTTAKDLIFPANDPYDDPDEQTHRMYVRTHGRLHPGEQKNRGYDWAAHGIDPTAFRFGAKDPLFVSNGAELSMKPTAREQAKTVIVNKAVEDFKDVNHDALGQPRNLGFGDRKLPPDFTFGKPLKMDEMGVRELMRGVGAPKEPESDSTLGKTSRPGFRNYTDTRAFGIPTVRNDVNKPSFKRFTNYQNYGDEPKAEGLIYPSRYAGVNIYEEDFLQNISQQDMWKLQQDCGMNLNDDDFGMAWNRAKNYSKDGSVCVETFRRAVAELEL